MLLNPTFISAGDSESVTSELAKCHQLQHTRRTGIAARPSRKSRREAVDQNLIYMPAENAQSFSKSGMTNVMSCLALA